MKLIINNKLEFNTKKKPLLIAEISGNHGNNKKNFLDLIVKSHQNGADLVKIQTYEPKDLTLKLNTNGFKIKSGIWKNEYLWDLYSKSHTPFEWHYEAFKLAKEKKINLFSTPFNSRAVEFLEKFDVPLYKISSFEIIDHKLIDSVAKTRKPIILSTGLSSIKEIKEAINIINQYHKKIIILHCVSEYPTKNENINFNRILLLKKKFKKNLFGISDHTDNIFSSLLSLPYKVVAIEKHVKLNSKSKTTDSSFSISLEQLKNLSLLINSFHRGLNYSNKSELRNESKNSLIFRKSIFSIKNIKKGEYFTENNIETYRYKYGLKANMYFKILGRKSKKNFNKFSPISI